jgi:hypothetical protein
MRSFHRWMVVVAAAGVLSVGVPLAIPVPASAAVGTPFGQGDSRPGEPPSSQGQAAPSARDTTTVTTTCGNGLIVLGPIVLSAAPFSTTVIQCEPPPAAGGTHVAATVS